MPRQLKKLISHLWASAISVHAPPVLEHAVCGNPIDLKSLVMSSAPVLVDER